MANRIPWDLHEAVILLQGLLDVRANKVLRTDAVANISSIVRFMATQNGHAVDEKFRNTSGISLQMSHLEYALTNGETGLGPVYKWQYSIIEIFRNDPDRYMKLLEEVKAMSESVIDTRTDFITWLDMNMSAEKSELIKNSITTSDLLLRKNGEVDTSVLDINNQSSLDKLINRLKTRKIIHSKRLSTRVMAYVLAVKDYKTKSNNVISSQESSDLFLRNEEEFAADYLENGKVDFQAIHNMAFTKPVSLTYFNEIIGEYTWRSLYIDLLSRLAKDYPYVFSRLLNDSLSGTVKTWITDDAHKSFLRQAGDIGNGYFVEVNRSATDIIQNMKIILDECEVDYRNVKVEYSSNTCHKAENNKIMVRKELVGIHNNFFQWMFHEKGLAESTCRSYISSIHYAEKYARLHNLASTKLFNASQEEARDTVNALYSNPDFSAYDIDQHYRFRAAITKLLEFLGEEFEKVPSEIAATRENTYLEVDIAPFKSVLKKHFGNGFCTESAIDIRKFKRYYEKDNSQSLSLDNDQLNHIIEICGIEHKGRIYLPDEILSEELRVELFDYINHCFSDGATSVYYEALFQHFYDDFLDYGIYDTEMLKSYIAYYAGNSYVFERSYLSKDHLEKTDPTAEIRELLINHVFPMKIADIAKTLPHIPEETIRSILGTNLEFVRTSKGVYFHADCFEVSDKELDEITDMIQDEVNINGYISGAELYNNIKKRFPYVYEKNETISVIGYRDAIKYKLRNRFSFDGNIISSKEKALSMGDVFSLYGKNRQSFTLTEILSLVYNVGSKVIYFDSLYENAARVSEKKFVRKDYVSYKVKETDEILTRFCRGDYIPISEIGNFGLFPDASYPWNEYLLENYLSFHSEQFELMHTGYNQNCVVGAMVRRSSGIKNYDELITRAIAASEVPLKKSDALSFLYKKGYVGRRTYKGIDSLLIKARALRNRKEQ